VIVSVVSFMSTPGRPDDVSAPHRDNLSVSNAILALNPGFGNVAPDTVRACPFQQMELMSQRESLTLRGSLLAR
jgi:hypothetical protein